MVISGDDLILLRLSAHGWPHRNDGIWHSQRRNVASGAEISSTAQDMPGIAEVCVSSPLSGTDLAVGRWGIGDR